MKLKSCKYTHFLNNPKHGKVKLDTMQKERGIMRYA